MEIGLLEGKQKKIESFSMLFLMSTLTWITGKELERVIKTRRRISLEEKHETFIVDFIAAVRK